MRHLSLVLFQGKCVKLPATTSCMSHKHRKPMVSTKPTPQKASKFAHQFLCCSMWFGRPIKCDMLTATYAHLPQQTPLASTWPQLAKVLGPVVDPNLLVLPTNRQELPGELRGFDRLCSVLQGFDQRKVLKRPADISDIGVPKFENATKLD